MRLELDAEVKDRLVNAQTLVTDGRVGDAVAAYKALLGELRDDPRQAAGVAHMYAIIVDDLDEKLAINEESLRLAESVDGDGFPFPLRATLFANIGWSHSALGDKTAAIDWYRRAQTAASELGDDDYGNMMRAAIEHHLANLVA